MSFRIVVFVSGRGSNLRSLVASAKEYSVVGVVSDKPNAVGLSFAQEQGIATFTTQRSDYSSLSEKKRALYAGARAFKPDLIALAGFMQIITPEFAEEFWGKLINIHPSLLPNLPGLHTHARALSEGHSLHGCTVHYVDSGVDTGPIIAQARVPVKPDDTEETLAARVLEQEHQIYPWVINGIARGEISVGADRKVLVSDALKKRAERLFIGNVKIACRLCV